MAPESGRRTAPALPADRMMGALFYLQAWTLINRLTSQVRRLRKPKYLAGFIAGGVYFLV